MKNKPFVSILIPCRNEEKYIRNCLDSVITNDYPKESLEILLIDGMSEDNTRKIIEEYKSENSFIKIIDNPKKFTPFAWNIGIKESRGEIVVLMGAHSTYHSKYISESVKFLEEYKDDKGNKPDNVGGLRKSVSEGGVVSRAISLSLSSIFGAGASYFKTGILSSDPGWVDTVFGGVL